MCRVQREKKFTQSKHTLLLLCSVLFFKEIPENTLSFVLFTCFTPFFLISCYGTFYSPRPLPPLSVSSPTENSALSPPFFFITVNKKYVINECGTVKGGETTADEYGGHYKMTIHCCDQWLPLTTVQTGTIFKKTHKKTQISSTKLSKDTFCFVFISWFFLFTCDCCLHTFQAVTAPKWCNIGLALSQHCLYFLHYIYYFTSLWNTELTIMWTVRLRMLQVQQLHLCR